VVRVLNLGNSDLGGDGIRTKHAFARYAPGWTYNVAVRNRNYIDYPVDAAWDRVRPLVGQADVIHARNSFKAARLAGAVGMPLVIHHHGTRLRSNPGVILAEQRAAGGRGAVGLAATLDLWLLAPDELEWLPAPYDLDWLASLRRPVNDDVLRVGHAPTNRVIKSTNAFLAAVDKLSRETKVELVLIEGQSWQRCLELKATCDIYFDQVILGYGNNAIEAWGMGIPVVAGAADATLAEYEDRFGDLPFVLADEGSIYQALAKLADPIMRSGFGLTGAAHARRWHDEARVVTQLQDIYLRAVERAS
jgi:hypothetical protein